MVETQVCRTIAGIAIALATGPAAAIDFDDPDSGPLHFAVETVSDEAATRFDAGSGAVTYYNVEAPADDAALTTTTKRRLVGSERWYVRVDLDGMVFSATPVLGTSGAEPGSGFASTAADVVAGGAARPFVIYRLPEDRDFARDLTFSLSVRDALAVPADTGRYRATIALYDNLGEAFDRDRPVSPSAFGGEKTIVVMTPGLEFGFESGIAVADVEKEFLAFTAESASGNSADPDNPSAPAVLGSIAVGARQADPGRGRAPVYAARGGKPVVAEDLIESVSVRVAGDMTFGRFDLRTGTAADRCLYTSPPSGNALGGGAVALAPPVGEEEVTTVGTATVAHRDEPFGTRHLCVWLPDEDQDPIPIGRYEATVSVTPPRDREMVEAGGIVGEIRRSGARVEITHLTTSDRYDQRIVIVNVGQAAVRYEFVSFAAPDGVTVALSEQAAAARDSGLNRVPAGSQAVLSVAETLRIRGGADGPPMTAATLSFTGNERDIEVATILTTRADGSTDTVVYAPRPSVEPEDGDRLP